MIKEKINSRLLTTSYRRSVIWVGYFIFSKSYIEMLPPVLEMDVIRGVWVMEVDLSWMTSCCPHGNKWVLNLLVYVKAGCLKKPDTTFSLSCFLYCHVICQLFLWLHHACKLKPSRYWYHACTTSRTIEKVNLFSS